MCKKKEKNRPKNVRRNNVRCTIYVRRKNKRTREDALILELTIVRRVYRKSREAVNRTSFVHHTFLHRTLVHRLLAVVLGIVRLFLELPEEGTHGLFAVVKIWF